MTTSLIRTILFGAPAITHAGRIIRFNAEEEVQLPTVPTIRRRIIECIGGNALPSTGQNIAQHLGLPYTTILEQLH